MSEAALCKGIVARLRAVYGDDGTRVHYAPDLKPPPAAMAFRDAPYCVTVGKCSSTAGPVQGGDASDRIYTVQVAVTGWLAYAPLDRQGSELAGPLDDPLFAQADAAAPVDHDHSGLVEVADEIAAYLVKTYATVTAADAYIRGAGTTTNGFCEPFKTATVGDAQPAPALWVQGADALPANEIYTATITLSGARRIRVTGTL